MMELDFANFCLTVIAIVGISLGRSEVAEKAVSILGKILQKMPKITQEDEQV